MVKQLILFNKVEIGFGQQAQNVKRIVNNGLDKEIAHPLNNNLHQREWVV
ncbi:hypothetical protein ACV56Z_09820 [Staphylococcus aureus]